MLAEPNTDIAGRAAVLFKAVIANPEAVTDEVSQLVSEARRAGDPAGLAAALRVAGWLERCELRLGDAERTLDEAVRIARRNRLQHEWREALTSRGAVRHERGRIIAAQRDFDRAGELVGDQHDFELDTQRAALLQNTGRLEQAAALYRSILERPEVPADVRTKAANNLGLLEVWCGRPRSGLAWCDVASRTADEVGPAAAAFVAATRAWATVRAGDLAGGILLYEEVAQAWRKLGIPVAELFAEYADALADLRLIPEAQREAARAVVALDEHGFELIAVETELRLARLSLLRGDAADAAGRADRVADRLRGKGRRPWAAQARLVGVEARLMSGCVSRADLRIARRAADALETAGFTAESVDAHLTAGRVAIRLAMTSVAVDELGRSDRLALDGPLLTRLKGHVAGALVAVVTDQPGVSIERSRAGLADLARHRAALPSIELRTLASGHGAELGRIGLAAVSRHGRPADVFVWMERTRAAALGHVEVPNAPEIGEELGQLRVVQTELTAARRNGSPTVGTLLSHQASLEDKIRRATWRHSRVTSELDRSWTPTSLRSLLAGDVLVEYDVLDGNVVAILLERHRSRFVKLGPYETVRRDTADLRFALRRLAHPAASLISLDAARLSAQSSLDALREALVDPLGLKDPTGIVVVPVGDLQRTMWTALHEAPVTVAPSAAMWARSRIASSGTTAGTTLIAGPDLPGAVDEVRTLARIHRRANVLVPPASSVANATAGLSGAALVHFACHGTVRVDNPTFSSLLLADGPLTIHDLERDVVAPHRVILAACESGSDTTYDGNESLGFVSTLLARGTAGLIAPSVIVPDWNLQPMMTTIHRALQDGITMATALHRAARLDQHRRSRRLRRLVRIRNLRRCVSTHPSTVNVLRAQDFSPGDLGSEPVAQPGPTR